MHLAAAKAEKVAAEAAEAIALDEHN